MKKRKRIKGKKQLVPGSGKKPKSGEKKIKAQLPGGKRVWVIVKSSHVIGGRLLPSGEMVRTELKRGVYPASETSHPKSGVPALKIGEDSYLVTGTLESQGAEVEISDISPA